jgi:hypothetical protein
MRDFILKGGRNKMKYYEVTRTANGEEMSLCEASDEVVILKGDQYHDKIGAQIEGFFKCLDHLSINHECRYYDYD